MALGLEPTPDLTNDENAHKSYFSLRLAMVALTGMLFAGVLIMLCRFDCNQGSISAYYFTPVRPVLIASLTAIGVGLVVYHGTTWIENVCLDVAGFMVVIVAFVPTGEPEASTGCNLDDGLLTRETLDRLQINPDQARSIQEVYVARLGETVTSAIAVSVVSLIVAATIGLIGSRFLRPDYTKTKPILSTTRKLSLSISTVLLLAGVALFLVADPADFRLWAHRLSAGIFFALIIGVMVVNAVAAGKTGKRKYSRAYWFTVVGIFLAVVVIMLLRARIPLLFWLEAVGVTGFMVFWIVQTRELGGFIDRDEKERKMAPDSAGRSPAADQSPPEDEQP